MEILDPPQATQGRIQDLLRGGGSSTSIQVLQAKGGGGSSRGANSGPNVKSLHIGPQKGGSEPPAPPLGCAHATYPLCLGFLAIIII